MHSNGTATSSGTLVTLPLSMQLCAREAGLRYEILGEGRDDVHSFLQITAVNGRRARATATSLARVALHHWFSLGSQNSTRFGRSCLQACVRKSSTAPSRHLAYSAMAKTHPTNIGIGVILFSGGRRLWYRE